MNKVTSLLKKLRQVLTVFLVAITFFAIPAFGYSTTLQAHAANTVTTPEGTYYKGVPDSDVNDLTNKANRAADRTGKNAKSAVNNIREKLNLDEPMPRSTKNFLQSTKEKVEDSVKPITGNNEGYYQDK
ncbi:MAG: hypothetical protein KME40_03135 [Komarekiella atlantica HA4396-MV6]|jgi:ElaB/YqjD/DUF883 family membrane-anchored ribosome-binding protein|nr:hypothetical protein [Komarekiella atlantica HA4396-MV6]